MSKKLPLTLLIVSLASFGVFFALEWNASPPGIEPKGSDSSLSVQYLSLATAVVSLLTAMIGLIKTTGKSRSGDT